MSEETTENVIDLSIHSQEPKKSGGGFFMKLFFLITLVILVAISATGLLLYTLNQPSPDFPLNEPIIIAPGTQVRTITEQLKAEGVVQSQQLLYYILVFMHDPADLKASTYVFDAPLDTFAIARRLTEGDFDTDLLRFTHIEGERASAVAARAAEIFPSFDPSTFLENAQPFEGKLFPETYFVPPTYDDVEFLALLLDTYEEKITPLRQQITSSQLSEDEIIILASILEREANSPESMRIVSGILQNRLAIGMALQADATIEYVIETPLGKLPPGQLASELRELDSPYNTYLYTGLPPTAIGNPGLEAISAVLNPTDTEYFYYVTDDSGVFHYAQTYDQHLQNIETHLR